MFHPVQARRAEGPIVDPDDTLGAPSGLALLRQGSAAVGANTTTGGATTAFEDLFPSYVAMRRGGTAAGADGSPRRDSVGGPPMRALPRVPFYGLLRKLQVDVGLPDAAPGLAESPTKAHRAEQRNEAAAGGPQGIGIPPHDATGARLLTTLELDDIVSRCCGYFRYGNRGHLRDLAGDSGESAAVPGSRASGGGAANTATATRPSAMLNAAALVDRRERYARYVDAACDAYRQFRAPYLARRARSRHSGNTGVASAAAAATTQSLPFRGFYFICHDHPRWKTFAAMFFEESPDEQQVVVASESASLQTFLSQACVDVGASADQLEWLDGALLLSTGSRFGHDGTDPIEAVFDALLNIQDATMPSRVAGDAFNPNGTAAAGVGAAQAFDRACGQSGMNGLVPAHSLPDVPLIADYVSVLSPVPFRGGEWQHFRAHKVQNSRTGSIATPQASWLLGDVRGVGDVLLPSAVQSLSAELTQLGVSFSLFFTTLSPNTARGRGSVGAGKLANGKGNVSGAGRVMHAVQRDRPQADVGSVFGEAKVTAVAPWLTFSRLSAQEWLSFADVTAAKAAEGHRRDEDDDGGADEDAVDAIFTPVCLQVWPELAVERRCYVQSSVLKLF